MSSITAKSEKDWGGLSPENTGETKLLSNGFYFFSQATTFRVLTSDITNHSSVSGRIHRKTEVNLRITGLSGRFWQELRVSFPDTYYLARSRFSFLARARLYSTEFSKRRVYILPNTSVCEKNFYGRLR